MNALRIGWPTCWIFLLAGLWAAPTVWSQNFDEIPSPRPTGWVVDLTGAVPDFAAKQLNELCEEIHTFRNAEMAVVVIESLDGKSIEEFANQLFNLWGIGKREFNNGVLLLWATGDRRVRIEVGTGLEAQITDSRAGSVLDDHVIPRFKQGRFDDGVLAGMEVLATLVRGENVAAAVDGGRVYSPVEDPAPAGGVFGTAVRDSTLALWGSILSALGLIGGLFGFRRWRRYRKRYCPSCNSQMSLLSETADDAHLEKPGQLEERLGSVDYDVWQCPSCEHRFTLRYPRWFTSYGSCPQCSHRTCSKTETTIRAATTYSSGRARVTEDCEFCTYHREYHRTIPRIRRSSSSSGSSSSFGGGSSSGGGASRGY